MSVVTGLPRVFRDAKAILGESIVWDADRDDVLWCDITAGLLHRSPLDGAADGSGDTTLRLPPPLASFGFAFDEASAGLAFVASLGNRIVRIDGSGTVTDLAPIDHAHPGLRLNEGKVDPFGHWVTGSMNLTTGDPDGAFYRVSEAGAVQLLRGGFSVANGLEWSLDGSRMYFTDTSVATIYVGDYSPTGELTDVKPFHAGEPHDGLAIDTDEHLWSGCYGEGKVVRYSPEGAELETIELPAPNITSVAFGGRGLSTLFVASARENLTEEQLLRHPLSGAVFAVDTSVHGRRPRSFGSVEK